MDILPCRRLPNDEGNPNISSIPILSVDLGHSHLPISRRLVQDTARCLGEITLPLHHIARQCLGVRQLDRFSGSDQQGLFVFPCLVELPHHLLEPLDGITRVSIGLLFLLFTFSIEISSAWWRVGGPGLLT